MILLALSLVFPGAALCAEQGTGKKKIKAATPGSRAKTDQAATSKAGQEPKTASGEPSPGQINARAAMLVEVSTGTVLFEQNADDAIEPASFTKILSLYLVFEQLQAGRIHLNDEIWVSEAAWRTGGSKMFVGIGTKVPLEELLKGIAVVSGNDACVAAAEHLSGSADTFVDNMNAKAKELGMNRSRFMNPHGLPADGQITTARDMALLDAAYLRRFPESLRFHSMHDYTYNNITQYNRNHLILKDPAIDGLKTGFVGAAGYHLSATSQKDGMRLLAVVMGAASPRIREQEALKLLNFGFRYYTLVQPFPKGQPLATAKVWKGEVDEVGLFAQDAPAFLISQTQKNQLRWEVHAPKEITAPLPPGQTLGEVVFYVSDQPRRTVALVNNDELKPGGWFKRTWQTLLFVHSFDWRWFAGILGGILLVAVLFFVVTGVRGRSRRF
ncbi:MAG: D-alanyl-D-alanine carboxypeptidase family protein [Syntrophobacteraceae bacterium]